jgi:hypothetical protein
LSTATLTCCPTGCAVTLPDTMRDRYLLVYFLHTLLCAGALVKARSLSFWLSAVYGPESVGVSPASGAGRRPALPGKPRKFLDPTEELYSPAS